MKVGRMVGWGLDRILVHPWEQDFVCGWKEWYSSHSGVVDKIFQISPVFLELDQR